MLTELLIRLKNNDEHWALVKHLFIESKIPAKTNLLNQGDIAQYIYFIKKGRFRIWHNNDGVDISIGFFFEDEVVSSLNSFYFKEPSNYNIQSLSKSIVVSLSREAFSILLFHYPELKDLFIESILNSMKTFSDLYISQLKDNKDELYKNLCDQNPRVIKYIPQYQIASFLGISPQHLSSLKNQKHQKE